MYPKSQSCKLVANILTKRSYYYALTYFTQSNQIRSLYDAVPCVQNEGSPLILVHHFHPSLVAENQLEAHLEKSLHLQLTMQMLYMECHLMEVNVVPDGSALGDAYVGGDDGRAAEPVGDQVAVEHPSPAH